LLLKKSKIFPKMINFKRKIYNNRKNKNYKKKFSKKN
jgi:hypothetical protein